MRFNPNMLYLAREAKGLTQGHLASAVGISQGHLSKLQSGVVQPTDELLAQMSVELSVPVSFFGQTEPLIGPGLTDYFHRKQQTIPAKVLNPLHAQVDIRRLQIEKLLRTVDIDPSLRMPSFDIEAIGAPEEAARQTRALWRLPAGPIENPTALLEAAGVVVVLASLGTPRLSGITTMCRMPSTPILVINTDMPPDRCIWTMAHELGHLVLHSAPGDDIEREADAFAAEFLMPEADIAKSLKNFSIERAVALKPYWRVSMASLAYRARRLGEYTDRQLRTFFQRMNQTGYRYREPHQPTLTPPTLIRQIIDALATQQGYSDEDLAALMNMNVDAFRVEYRDASPMPRLRVVPKRPHPDHDGQASNE